jgi:hypothetical protein
MKTRAEFCAGTLHVGFVVDETPLGLDSGRTAGTSVVSTGRNWPQREGNYVPFF